MMPMAGQKIWKIRERERERIRKRKKEVNDRLIKKYDKLKMNDEN